VAAGTLPSDKLCVNCGAATHGVLHCEVECERPWAKGARLGFWRTLSFILHPSLAFHSEWDDGETHGRQTVVEVPLRMCRQCRTAARGWTTNNLIELLHTVRLYDELLREYPEATASLSSRRGEEP
jgi:hypothetical protein